MKATTNEIHGRSPVRAARRNRAETKQTNRSLVRFTQKVFHTIFQYLVVWVVVGWFTLLLRVLNRCEIYGRDNLPSDLDGVLLASKHQSLIDSFLHGTLYNQKVWWRPWRYPWSMPEKKNFYSHKLLRLLMSYLNSIPVDRDDPRSAVLALRAGMTKLETAPVSIFPAATRQRPGQSYEAKAGMMMMVFKATNAKWIVPIAFTGMDEVQPYRKSASEPSRLLRLLLGDTLSAALMRLGWMLSFRTGKTIRVKIGKAFTPDELRAMVAERGGTDDLYQTAANIVMEKINELDQELLAMSKAA